MQTKRTARASETARMEKESIRSRWHPQCSPRVASPRMNAGAPTEQPRSPQRAAGAACRAPTPEE
jgi:hypothetical protein